MKKSFYFLIFFVLGLVIIQAQQTSKKQKELEAQRLSLKKEIKHKRKMGHLTTLTK